MSTRDQLTLGFSHRHQHSFSVHPDDPELMKRRFSDIKQDIGARADIEVTNDHVFSILFDLYWLHHEQPGLEPTGGVPADD